MKRKPIENLYCDGVKMNLNRDKDRYYITLDKDEYINQSLLNIANNEEIKSGWINGIGAIYDIEIGYFDVNKKDYVKKKFKGHYELISLLGNISIKDGNKFIHTHISFCGTDYKVIGGHLFDAQIAAAGEFIIDASNLKIERKYNQDIGLHLWCMK